MDKTSGYVRTVVAFHNLRDKYKEAVDSLQEKGVAERVKEGWDKTREDFQTRSRNFFTHPDDVVCEYIPPQFGYIFRPKSRWELVLLSGTVCGIEFCYAAETAFVTPILLNLGLKIKFVTMIWCLSPLIGFFLTPILGSLSDSCDSVYGRRRPFILLLSAGILLGLILVPNGRHIGAALGDTRNLQVNVSDSELKTETYTDSVLLKNMTSLERTNRVLAANEKRNIATNVTSYSRHNDDYRSLLAMLLDNPSHAVKDSSTPQYLSRKKRMVGKGNVQSAKNIPAKHSRTHLQPWSITFTVLGTILLDFCSDACQSPSRTYLLDVSLHEDHNAGLSTFTVMAGLGGAIGYLTGAIHWESTYLGTLVGGQINAVFMLVTIVFIICLIGTLKSFPEIPLPLLRDPKILQEYQQKLQIGEYQEKGNEMAIMDNKLLNYGTTSANDEFSQGTEPTPNGIVNDGSDVTQVEKYEGEDKNRVPALPIIPTEPKKIPLESDIPTLKEYLRSIVHMPKSLRILCLTNLFCWMSLVCYSLYFTDFVGEVVYGGDPSSPEGTYLYELYKDGVSFGCWGMALYSLSCSIYSCFIESFVMKFGAKRVYIGGQLVYSVGMIIMAAARHPAAVILLSPTAGIMYSTLFTMPYLLIAHYHCMQKFRDDLSGGDTTGVRGIGTDVASVGSMVFLSQFILSLTMGSIVEAVGSNVVPVCAAAILSACGAVCATRVLYLDM